MIIDELVALRGDAVKHLGLTRGPDGLVDISHDNWAQALVVLKDLVLDRVKLVSTEILPNFVRSRFSECRFENIISSHHFWGASNSWNSCVFENMKLLGAISHGNVFSDCKFTSVALSAYRPSETIFSGCTFTDVVVSGLRAVRVRGRPTALRDIERLGASLAFVNCTFRRTRFDQCVFSSVAFEGCKFEDVGANACEFVDIKSDQIWWAKATGGTPFLAFLDELIRRIAGSLGRSSMAHLQLTKYRDAYASGKTISEDYSACFYNGSVPESELDVVETLCDVVEEEFPDS